MELELIFYCKRQNITRELREFIEFINNKENKEKISNIQ